MVYISNDYIYLVFNRYYQIRLQPQEFSQNNFRAYSKTTHFLHFAPEKGRFAPFPLATARSSYIVATLVTATVRRAGCRQAL